MKKILMAFSTVTLLLLIVVPSAKVKADSPGRTLIVTMANDPSANSVIVIDAATRTRLQTLSTNGKGGVGNNARGVKQYNGQLFAAVNNGSGTVALFRRADDHLVFEQLVVTTSPPVSIDVCCRGYNR
jgi:hypothetical protein